MKREVSEEGGTEEGSLLSGMTLRWDDLKWEDSKEGGPWGRRTLSREVSEVEGL